MLLGLVLGDAVGAVHGKVPTGSTSLVNTVAAQLACVTAEGLIRASVRANAKGICHPPTVVWHALARWAYGQRIPAESLYRFWSTGTGRWPDGWLAQVPLVRERRGNAPATVTAVQSGEPGTREGPLTGSGGSHALIRALPVSAVPWPMLELQELAADIAVQTHRSAVGFVTASESVLVTACCLNSDDVHAGLHAGVDAFTRLDPSTHHADLFRHAINEGSAGSGDQGRLRGHFATERSATATFAGALYAAAAHPRAEQVLDALRFASAAPGVAAVTGGLLGAVHGVDALPIDELSRCELVWVADTLARDLVTQFTSSPDGQESWTQTAPGQYNVGWADGSEPGWWQRYPGW